ncbi:ArsR/SmtB family transcription factor [Bacillus toyonensis]|uniref:ArsR/SmtB family transcription factor n=1 Tax=Bacillus toyonensis TaxID=155322 RepID=UPI003D6557E1
MKGLYTYKKQAEILNKIGHPVRLCILQQLIQRDGCSVTELRNILGIPQSTISQHFGILRSLDISRCRSEGVMKIYNVEVFL